MIRPVEADEQALLFHGPATTPEELERRRKLALRNLEAGQFEMQTAAVRRNPEAAAAVAAINAADGRWHPLVTKIAARVTRPVVVRTLASPRERRPRRVRVRSSGAASRDGPDEPDEPEPPLGRLTVTAKAAA